MFNAVARKEALVLEKYEGRRQVEGGEMSYNDLRLILAALLNEKGTGGVKEVREALEFLEPVDGIELGFRTSVSRGGRVFDVLVYTSQNEAARLGDRAKIPEFAVINLALRSRLGALVTKKLYPVDWYLNHDPMESLKIEDLVKDVAEVVLALEAKVVSF